MPSLGFLAFYYTRKTFNRNLTLEHLKFIRELHEDVDRAEEMYIQNQEIEMTRRDLEILDRKFINKVENFCYIVKRLDMSNEDVEYSKHAIKTAKNISTDFNPEKEGEDFIENIDLVIKKYNL